MKVIDETLLDEFRRAARCGYCNKPTPCGCDPHHWRHKGLGGGARLDIRENLIALCRACHCKVHSGEIQRFEILAMIAARENTTQNAIQAKIWELLRTPK